MTPESLKKEVAALFEEISFYTDKRATKAGSKRIRTMLGELKKKTPDYRRMMIEEDKKQ